MRRFTLFRQLAPSSAELEKYDAKRQEMRERQQKACGEGSQRCEEVACILQHRFIYIYL